MINAANLPAVRARADGTEQAGDASRSTVATPSAVSAPSYPAKKLVLENGRYVVAETTK